MVYVTLRATGTVVSEHVDDVKTELSSVSRLRQPSGRPAVQSSGLYERHGPLRVWRKAATCFLVLVYASGLMLGFRSC